MVLTHKERVRRAIYREPLDYFPTQIDFTTNDLTRVAEGFGVPPEELDVCFDNHLAPTYSFGSAEYYRENPALIAKGEQFGLCRLDEGDQIIYDCWGVGWDLTAEGVWIKVHPIDDFEKYRSYQFPDPAADGLMYHAEKTIKKFHDEYFVIALQHIGLFERCWALHGFENFMINLHQNRSFIQELLGRVTDYQVALAQRFVDCGVDGVRFGDDYGSQIGLLMRPQDWRELIKPCLKRIYRVYQDAGLPVMQHSCGDLRQILDDFVELGLNMLHPLQPQAMPLEEVAEGYGKKLSFFGGIDTQQLLPYGTPGEIDCSTKYHVELLGKNGGYMIAPSQEIMSDVPIENIKALVNAAHKYRYLLSNRGLHGV